MCDVSGRPAFNCFYPQVWPTFLPSFLFLPLATMAEKDTTARLRRAVKGSLSTLTGPRSLPFDAA